MARQAKKHRDGHPDKDKNRQRNRQTNKQIDGKTGRERDRETDIQTKTKTDTKTEGQSISNLVLSPVAQYGYIMARVRARRIDNSKQQIENERNAYRHIKRQNEIYAALKCELEKRAQKKRRKARFILLAG